MDISSSQQPKDRISELPDDVLYDCLSLLEMKDAAQTSILSRRWRYLWTHLTNFDFDPEQMFPEEFESFWRHKRYETRRYFAWINQVVSVHRGTSIDKFRVHSRYVTSYTDQFDKWVMFALGRRVKHLELDLIYLIGDYSPGAEPSRMGYPFGFDILRHPPCYTGITALQSLYLCHVDVSGEFLEFLLSRCHLLERLYLNSTSVRTFKVKSSKLKYLTIVMRFHDLVELEIDAENLMYFSYDGSKVEREPRMVFKCFPMLVETSFCGALCRYPVYPIFEKLSLFSTQLCKLSLELELDLMRRDVNLVIPDGVIPTFPNVKHFTCTTVCYDFSCILSMKRFIEACPMLEEFKLQVIFMLLQESREATELQAINLEDEEKTENLEHKEHRENSLQIGQADNVKGEKQSHPNLRVLELVGFLGVRCDVQLALAVVNYARSLHTIICDTRGIRYTGGAKFFYSDAPKEYDVAKTRARKLAKIVAPQVKVVTI